MAERASLSIDGYTHTGGTMAQEIAINSAVIDQIAQTGRLRSNLSVVWTNELPPKHRLGLGRKTHHPLFERRGAVILRINDDLLSEKAERQAKKRSANGEGYYHALTREEFLRGFNDEVARGLTSTLYTDKISFRKHPLEWSTLTLVALSVLSHLPPGGNSDWKALAIAGAGTAYALWMSDRAESKDPKSRLFAPASFIRGYWQILKNQSQLIVERD